MHIERSSLLFQRIYILLLLLLLVVVVLVWVTSLFVYAVYVMAMISVCPSVTLVNAVKTARRIRLFTRT